MRLNHKTLHYFRTEGYSSDSIMLDESNQSPSSRFDELAKFLGILFHFYKIQYYENSRSYLGL